MACSRVNFTFFVTFGLKLASPVTDGHVALLTSGKVESFIFIKFELLTLCQVLKDVHNFCGSSGIVRVNDTRRMT